MKNCDVRYDFVYDMATNFILDENITLPVMNMEDLCKRLGILVLSDKEMKKKYNIDYRKLVNSDDGTAIYLPSIDKYVIVYSTKVAVSRRIKFTLGHELGHIILGHLEVDDISYEDKEKEAEYFSMLLIMHPLLLFRNSVNSYKEVELLCQTTVSAAKAGFNNYKNFCKFHNFLEYDCKLLDKIDKDTLKAFNLTSLVDVMDES